MASMMRPATYTSGMAAHGRRARSQGEASAHVAAARRASRGCACELTTSSSMVWARGGRRQANSTNSCTHMLNANAPPRPAHLLLPSFYLLLKFRPERSVAIEQATDIGCIAIAHVGQRRRPSPPSSAAATAAIA